MMSLRQYALAIGVITALLLYATIRFVRSVAPPWIVFDVMLVALAGGLIGLCFYLLFRVRLRRVVLQVRESAALIAGVSPSSARDEFEELRQTYDRALTTLARRDRYRAITDQLLSSDNLAVSFRVIAEHAASTLPIDGAALFMREDTLLRSTISWHMNGSLPLVPEQDTALWRVVRQNRPLRLTQEDAVVELFDLRAAALLLPVVVADQPVGVLMLVNRTNPDAFCDDDLMLARFFAGQLALAVRLSSLSDLARVRENQVATVSQVARDLGGSMSLDEILQEVLTAAAALTASHHGTILLLDSKSEQVTHRIALDSGNMAPLEIVAKPILRHGLAGWVIRERRAALIRDTEEDGRWLPGPGLGEMRSALVVPLLANDQVLGVITLAHEMPGHYNAEHQQLLETLSAQAALGIERATLRAASRPTIQSVQTYAPVSDGIVVLPEQLSTHEVVAVSADLRGLHRASQQLSLQDLATEVLEMYFQTMARAIQPQGGVLERTADGGILAVFGYPYEQPSDVMRAVQAALTMRRVGLALRESWRERLGMEIGVAVGISRGPAIIGQVPGALNHTTSGQAVLYASRLQALARSNEVLAAANVVNALENVQDMFDIAMLPPLFIHSSQPAEPIYRIDQAMTYSVHHVPS